MPPQPPCGKNPGWTVETLLTHIQDMIESHDRRYLSMFSASDKATSTALTAAEKAVNAALAASDKAVSKAEESQLRVNASQNEFRQQLKDQAATFVTREMMEAIDRRMQLIEKANAGSAGGLGRDAVNQGQQNWAIGIGVAIALGIAGIVASVVSIFKK